jgi:hypothetical protein
LKPPVSSLQSLLSISITTLLHIKAKLTKYLPIAVSPKCQTNPTIAAKSATSATLPSPNAVNARLESTVPANAKPRIGLPTNAIVEYLGGVILK